MTYPLLRDRLRAVQCPSDMIDQIGGWATAGVGQAYGEGYNIDSKLGWLERINLPHKTRSQMFQNMLA